MFFFRSGGTSTSSEVKQYSKIAEQHLKAYHQLQVEIRTARQNAAAASDRYKELSKRYQGMVAQVSTLLSAPCSRHLLWPSAFSICLIVVGQSFALTSVSLLLFSPLLSLPISLLLQLRSLLSWLLFALTVCLNRCPQSTTYPLPSLSTISNHSRRTLLSLCGHVNVLAFLSKLY